MKTLQKLLLLSFFSLSAMLLFITKNIGKESSSTIKSFSYTIKHDKESESSILHVPTNGNIEDLEENSAELKYILQWTPAKNVPFMFMGKGREGFIDRNCPFTNCYVTENRNYLGGDITKFDVIAFSGPQVIRMNKQALPGKRSSHQKYAFAAIESSDYYPVCSNKLDGFFNWTWTFRLDSEVRWGYMVVRDRDNNVVGPNKDMNWIKFEDMDPVSDAVKNRLQSKTKAAAWFVSNCISRSKREQIVKELQKELKQYDLTVDVYGKCGPLKCSRSDEAACFDLIKKEYYFYISFENSFSEDYATEKLLNAMQNDAVPIVYGAANYTR